MCKSNTFGFHFSLQWKIKTSAAPHHAKMVGRVLTSGGVTAAIAVEDFMDDSVN